MASHRPEVAPARARRLRERYADGSRRDRGPGRAPLARGPARPVHAGREPDQVAPRPHDLVLRDLRAGALRARLRAVRPSATRTSSTPTTRRSAPRQPRPRRGAADAALAGRGPRVPRHDRRARWTRSSTSAPEARRRARPHRARPAPRAAAPGADPHRHQARCCGRNPLRPAYRGRAAAAREPRRVAALAWIAYPGGLRRDRARRGRASRSTTSGRGTACSSSRSSSPRAR